MGVCNSEQCWALSRSRKVHRTSWCENRLQQLTQLAKTFSNILIFDVASLLGKTVSKLRAHMQGYEGPGRFFDSACDSTEKIYLQPQHAELRSVRIMNSVAPVGDTM